MTLPAVVDETVPAVFQRLIGIDIAVRQFFQGALIVHLNGDGVAVVNQKGGGLAGDFTIADAIAEICADVLISGGAALLAISDAQLHQRHAAKSEGGLSGAVTLLVVMHLFVYALGDFGTFQRDMLLTDLARSVVDQHPAVLDVGQGLAGGEHRVGRVEPPHLPVDFGAYDGVVRCAGTGDQQRVSHFPAADPRRLGLDATGLEHGSQQDRQVFTIAVAVLLDFVQIERHITALGSAPVAQVAVVLVDVLHQRADLVRR